jgi:putative oxidoreductase
MDTIKQYAPLIGRILIAQIFILAGISKLGTGFAGTAGWMASKGLPMAEVLLVLTIVIEIGGGLMILLGWKARTAAAVLFLWMIPVTFIFHNFWAVPADQKLVQTIMFQKNLAIMGTMCLIFAFGSGRYSLSDK